jgi:hypothetical protein
MQVKIKRLNEKYGYCFCTGTARMPVDLNDSTYLMSKFDTYDYNLLNLNIMFICSANILFIFKIVQDKF